MDAIPTRTRKGRKYDQVLEGARDVFLRDGFAGASVDEIARESGVSKATLYSYFPDKQQMFMEVARRECQRMADAAADSVDLGRPIAETLHQAAGQIVRLMLSPFTQRVFRICVAEADRFPELGREYYACGPGQGRDRLVGFLHEAVRAGLLEIEDFELAADQFAELCKVTLWPRMIFGLQADFSDAEVERVARGAAETFLARYGRG